MDISFWELALIGVVALLVVGPKELPALVRGVSAWVRRARQVAGDFKAEFTREVDRAEELKRLVERETEVAELHKALDEARGNISLDPPPAGRDQGPGGDGASAPGAPSGRERDGRTPQ